MGYHIAVTDLREGGSLEELAGLPAQGITSYKLFMAYKGALMVDDETLFRTMEVAAETGALVMVHAENGDAIDVLVKQALAAGNTAPHYHALTRPPETEGEATNRAIQLARVAGAPLYVVHVSCREAVEPIARAREQGWDVWGETCTQYFFIDYTYLERPDFEGAKYVYTPPPRAIENQDVLWHAVRSDILSAVSTDHCAFLWDGQKSMGKDDFSKIPNGGPGLENRLHMIHEFGVRAGPYLAEPDGGAPRHEPGEALRPLPAQGHDRARLGRGHRHLRPGEAAPHHRRRRSTRRPTTTSTRAPRSRARPRSCSSAGTSSSRAESSSPSPVSVSSSSGPRSGRSSCPPQPARRQTRGGAGHLPPCPAPPRNAEVSRRTADRRCLRSSRSPRRG